MKRARILVADTRHFDPRKFRPLYDCAATGGIALWAETTRRAWWGCEGNYRSFAERLAPHRRTLAGVAPAELAAHRHRGIGVFGCARSELLRLLLPRWAVGAGAERGGEAIDRAFASAKDREDLLLCMAAAQDWIDFWEDTLARHGPFSHALFHSGSLIYTRTLREIGHQRGLRMFAAHRFSPFRDFFFEERATPLADQSLLADPAWYAGLALPEDAAERDRVRAEAHRRLLPTPDRAAGRRRTAKVAPPLERQTAGTALVVGQAINDCSLIETLPPGRSALEIYCRLIAGILERTDLHVVFKADPEERRRPNPGGPLTLRLLAQWSEFLPPGRRARLRLIESGPLDTLFSHAKLVVSLSSPALIEACRMGLKPVQIGRAFFGGKGFTHDFADPDAVVDALAAGGVGGCLSLEEHRSFEDFLVRALVLHLVPDGTEGVAKIAARLAEPNHVPTLRECSLSPAPRMSRLQTVSAAIANPVAALRLAMGRPPRHPS